MQKNIELSKGWLICTDPDNVGKEKDYAKQIQPDARPIPVPGIIQEVFTEYHGVVWYYYPMKKIPVICTDDEKMFLKFGAVDYFSELFIDGVKITENEGAENEFEVDVTDVLKDGSLIALRVINPKENTEIDGFEMRTIPHRNKSDGGFNPGCCYNSGGIMLPVILYAVSKVRVSDCFVRADWKTGNVQLETTIYNDTDKEIFTELDLKIVSSDCHTASTASKEKVTLAIGENIVNFTTKVDNHKLWSIDSPNMYDAEIICHGQGLNSSSYYTHFGFRDFRLVDGFFTLNGKRIFLKCAHTGNHMPIGLSLPAEHMPHLEFKDFQLAKACGFNCIRFISTQATPRQLDYCDRLGLMIYQETYASWCLSDSDKASERYNNSISAEVKRDRNHPCLTIWGALNETCISDAFYAAVNVLPIIRSLDDTRLCIFSSGRFDLRFKSDRDKPNFDIGCASNPGSVKWDHVWGDDGSLDESKERIIGDVHDYPAFPHSAEVVKFYRTYGANTKPCFFSEYGVGSHLNVIENCLEFERYGAIESSPDYVKMRSIRDRYIKDFYWYGMDSVYATPMDHLMDSQKYNAVSRRFSFDMVRSNPQFVGYNMTGLLDHAICGEGPFTLFRRFKQENFDVFQDGWADLRWCLFPAKTNFFAKETLHFEAVLADFDVLPLGKHSATFSITNEAGKPFFKKDATFTVPQLNNSGLRKTAYTVFDEDIKANLKPGKYIFRAYLNDGGYAGACEREFYVTAKPSALHQRALGVTGLGDTVLRYLHSYGIAVQNDYESCDTILAGNISEEEGQKLIKLAENGAKVIFIDENCDLGKFITLPEYSCFGEVDWLYHKESVVTNSKYAKGIKKGFYDWDFFGKLLPRKGFTTSKKAANYVCLNFYIGGPGDYHASVSLAEYKIGKGSVILNTLPILSNLGITPSADILLMNLVK